jgi:hypothetical protein
MTKSIHDNSIKATGNKLPGFLQRPVPPRLISGVEAVEKVSKQIRWQDVEKNDLIEYATINDLMLGKGQ